jgi:uncharacterized cupredoxin-like copper-binding protein
MEEVMSRKTSRSRRGVVGIVAVASAVLLSLTACGSSSSSESAAPAATDTAAAVSALGADQWISNPGDFKDAANWDIAKKLTLALGGGAINPASLDLVAGMPYEIAISNSDSADLGFSAQDLFRGSAVRKTESGAEIKMFLFKEVFVKAGKSINLFIIPVVPGTYELAGVDANGAPVSGMTGKVNVTGALPTKPVPAIAAISTLGMPAGADALISAAIPTWDATAVKATITMGDTAAAHFYKPKDTVLKVGVPATLTFVNSGNATHVNEMMDFFKTAALWKIAGADGWNTGGMAKPGDVDAGIKVSVYLIPTQAGSFSLTDSSPGMEKMTATITVK